MAKLGKRTLAAREALAGKEDISVEEAVSLVKSNAKAKFDETIEIAMNLGVDPRHADQMVRGSVTLPNGTGKSVRVAVFARGAKADEAKEAGADIVGAEDLMEVVQGGKRSEEHTSELQSHSDLVCRLLLDKKKKKKTPPPPPILLLSTSQSTYDAPLPLIQPPLSHITL